MTTFALDYDDTFSADPNMWVFLSGMMKDFGHRIVGVTIRSRDALIEDERYFSACDQVIYTAGRGKKELLGELEIPIDVWIDDKPEYIVSSWYQVRGDHFHKNRVYEGAFREMLQPLIIDCSEN